MFKPSLEEFLRLSAHGNVIPVYSEINSDLDTPVSAYLKLKASDFAFLFESVEGQEKIARYSFLGSGPSLVFRSKGRNIEIIYPRNHAQSRRFTTDITPLDELKEIMRYFKSVEVKGLPRFCGGLVGFMSYDTVRFFERIPDKNPDELKFPDCVFMLTDTILIFDHVNHTLKFVNNCLLPKDGKSLSRQEKIRIYNNALKRIRALEDDFSKSVREKKEGGHKNVSGAQVLSNLNKKQFSAIINKAKSYIRKGDIIQVVLSQRFKVRAHKDPLEIYRKLRSINPSPYMFLLKLKDMHMIGSSPEMLVRCEDGIIETRPIAGTRPRGKNEEEDNRLAQELIDDPKERAEHLMLVDLGRNDLGRVSQSGKVEVPEFMRIEKYSHVMHIVSEVKGKLDNKLYDIYDVLKAAFPAGTVSGSPKIRAMEIIDELENSRRGPYAGCVGYFSFSHNMDTCITIRTIVVKNGFAYIQAGAGIVADSIPAKEYTESVNKAKALIEAIVS